jgi:hypothetical protein
MKYLALRKLSLAAALLSLFALAGCGGNSSTSITQGNWSFAATPSGQGTAPFYIGGNLTQNGSNLSGSMYVINSCIDPSQQQTFSGTINAGKVTLTSAPDPADEVITMVLSANGSSLSGSYSITGGTCANGTSGTIGANPVASISGTWAGPLNDQNDPSATLSIALTQASTASADGTFALSGTLTYTNSLCEASGNITSGTFAGPYIIAINATNGNGDTVTYNYGVLDSTINPHQMTNGTYSVSGSSPCNNDSSVPTFTKQ